MTSQEEQKTKNNLKEVLAKPYKKVGNERKIGNIDGKRRTG
jgi:hypothetical protein